MRHIAKLGFNALALFAGSFGAAAFHSLLFYEQRFVGLFFWSLAFGLITGMKLPVKWAMASIAIYVLSALSIIFEILPLPVY